MSFNPQILIQQLSYSLPDGKRIFNVCELVFNTGKIGLIGKNGIGKTTLLKLIAGELQPSSGAIEISGKIAYLPQHYQFATNDTVADILEIKNKLQALERILSGTFNDQDYFILNEDWNIKESIQQQLAAFGLTAIELNRAITTLSGGELTRLRLAKIFLEKPNIYYWMNQRTILMQPREIYCIKRCIKQMLCN